MRKLGLVLLLAAIVPGKSFTSKMADLQDSIITKLKTDGNLYLRCKTIETLPDNLNVDGSILRDF